MGFGSQRCLKVHFLTSVSISRNCCSVSWQICSKEVIISNYLSESYKKHRKSFLGPQLSEKSTPNTARDRETVEKRVWSCPWTSNFGHFGVKFSAFGVWSSATVPVWKADSQLRCLVRCGEVSCSFGPVLEWKTRKLETKQTLQKLFLAFRPHQKNVCHATVVCWLFSQSCNSWLFSF